MFSGKISNYDKLIIKTLPNALNIHHDKLYNNLLSVCHHVSKLSDSNATITHKKFKGILF